MKINPINTIYTQPKSNNNNVKFGHIIPVDIMLDGEILPQNVANRPFFKMIVSRFCLVVNRKKGELAKKIITDFINNDSEFVGELNSIRGEEERQKSRIRYFVTGLERDNILSYFPVRNGKFNRTINDKYSKAEKSLRKDHSLRIPGLNTYVIEVVSKIFKKRDASGEKGIGYFIKGGHFNYHD